MLASLQLPRPGLRAVRPLCPVLEAELWFTQTKPCTSVFWKQRQERQTRHGQAPQCTPTLGPTQQCPQPKVAAALRLQSTGLCATPHPTAAPSGWGRVPAPGRGTSSPCLSPSRSVLVLEIASSTAHLSAACVWRPLDARVALTPCGEVELAAVFSLFLFLPWGRQLRPG